MPTIQPMLHIRTRLVFFIYPGLFSWDFYASRALSLVSFATPYGLTFLLLLNLSDSDNAYFVLQ